MSASEIHICPSCGYSERDEIVRLEIVERFTRDEGAIEAQRRSSTERDPFDRQREEALELVRIARMSMNPKVNAGWFERAAKLLKEVGVDHTEAVDG